MENPVFSISRITGDLYRVKYEGFSRYGHYSVFLVTPEGIIITDPCSEYDDRPALWLKQQLAERFDKPVRYVIYSHHHLDHAAGGDVFADTAEFIGHENMLKKFVTPEADAPLLSFFEAFDMDGDGKLAYEERGILAARFESWDMNQDGYLDGRELAIKVVDRVRKPDTVFSDRMTVELGGKKVELSHPGPNHSDDITIMYFPEERVVFVVDVMDTFNGLPGVFPFSSRPMSDWISSFKHIEAIDFDIFAGGHSPLGTKADVTLTRIAWQELHDQVKAGIMQGKNSEELQQTLRLDNYKHYPGHEKKRKLGIAEAYKAIMLHEMSGN